MRQLTYQPQATMKDSLRWAREHITRVVSVRDGKNIPIIRKINLLNLVNRTVWECLHRFRLPRLRSIKFENRGNLTKYPGMMRGDGTLYVNIFKATQWSLSLIELTVRHEIGHYFQVLYEEDIDEYFGTNPFQQSPVPTSLMYTYCFNRYCEPAWGECLAENFAYYSAGKQEDLDQKIIEFYAAFDTGRQVIME